MKAKVFLLMTALYLVAGLVIYRVAFNEGKEHAINNAIITNESRDKGNYIMELDGKTYYYWYE